MVKYSTSPKSMACIRESKERGMRARTNKAAIRVNIIVHICILLQSKAKVLEQYATFLRPVTILIVYVKPIFISPILTL